MLKRPTTIIVAFLVAMIGFTLYFAYRVPVGIAPKGGSAETIAWLALATAIVSLLTTIIGLIQKLIESSTSGRGG